MPLFRVYVSFDFVMEAEDKHQAELDAMDYAAEDLDNNWRREAASVQPIRALKDVPSDWRNSIPWGSENDLTCEAIFTAAEDAERKRIPTTEEIEAAGQQRLIG